MVGELSGESTPYNNFMGTFLRRAYFQEIYSRIPDFKVQLATVPSQQQDMVVHAGIIFDIPNILVENHVQKCIVKQRITFVPLL